MAVIAYRLGLHWRLAFSSFIATLFVAMNVFIGLPWLVGVAAGSIWLRTSTTAKRNMV